MDTRVEVTWTDSGLYYENGWETKEEIVENCTGIATIQTVGWLFHTDDTAKYVALSRDEVHGHYYGVQVIKTSNILAMRVL